MSNRYLIINADDFGVCTETNEAIEHLFNEGRITSTTVMAPSRKAMDAVNRAKTNSRIKMGVHLTFNCEYSNDRWSSIAPQAEVSSLLDEGGKFHNDVSLFYKNAKAHEVATEINAQYNFVAKLGYEPTHADSHCGTLYGLTGRPFIKEAFELCFRHKLPFRFPKSIAYARGIFKGNIPEEIVQTHKSGVMYAEKLGIHLPEDIITNPFSLKDIPSYEHLKEFYLNAIRNIGEGVTEIFLHPSKESSFHMAFYPEWKKRIWEYRFLLDDDFMKTIQDEDIRLVSWADAPFDGFN